MTESIPATILDGLTLEAVEWLPSGADTGLVRVRGRWSGGSAHPAGLPVLCAQAGGGVSRVDSLPDAPSLRGNGSVWRGAYLVPESVARGGLWLEWESGERSALPTPAGLDERAASGLLEPEPVEEDSPGGEVIDRAVLAERRARRAEAAEQAQARVASEALRALDALELRGTELEQRVEALATERDALAERARELEARTPRDEHQRRALADALAAAAAARQAAREWRLRMRAAEVARSSDAVRLRVVEAREAATAPLRAERAAQAAALEAERRRGRELAEEADRARRQAVAAAADLDEARRDFAERLEAGRGEVAEWERRAREAEAARDELEAREAELSGARAELERVRAQVAELEATVEAERAARAAAGAEAETARSEAASAGAALRAESVARAALEDELARERAARSALSDALDAETAALASLHVELNAERAAREAERSQLEADRAAGADPEELAAERAGSASLREELAAERASSASLREELAAERTASESLREELGAAEARGEELAAERAASAALREELAAAQAARDADAGALASLRDELAAERASLAALRDELEAERSARQADEAALRSQIDALRERLERGGDGGAGLRQEMEMARAADRAVLAALRADLNAERAAREADQAALDTLRAELRAAQVRLTQAGATSEGGLLERVAELDRRAAGLASELELQRRAREQAEAAAAAARGPAAESERVVADLDAAASSLRERAENGALAEPEAPAEAEAPAEVAAPTGAVEPAETEAPAEPADTAAAPAAAPVPAAAPPERPRRPIVSAPSGPARAHATGRSQRQYPWLRGALVKLAHDDPQTAGRIIAGLLPVQAAIVQGPVDYDLTIAEVGTFAVTVAGGRAWVKGVPAPRGRREAEFHLAADALTLAELIAGVPHRLSRFRGPARISGRKRRSRPLRAVPEARLSLAEAARAGARLEPGLVFRTFPYVIHAAWARNHSFTVAQEIAADPPETWYVTVGNGRGMRVRSTPPEGGADATVTMTPEAFGHLLRGEPVPPAHRPSVRGDREAVALLKRWLDRAQGA